MSGGEQVRREPPESPDDSRLAEFTAEACRRLSTGLLEKTGEDLRAHVAAEVGRLAHALRDVTVAGHEDPADPPRVNSRGVIVVNTNPVTSRRNALSPALTEKPDGDGITATVAPLPLQYQGPRGRVHGGYLGLLLDHVLWRAVYIGGDRVSFTRSLTVTYEQPAPIGQGLTVTGRITGTDGRKTFAAGEVRSGEIVCARAEGLWVAPRPRRE